MKLFKFVGKLGLLVRVILGLVLGIFVGIFLGEPASALDTLGRAYVGLLQMTVLPYILVSIVGAFGRLDAAMAQQIGLRGGGLVLVVWLATVLIVLCMPLAYPEWAAAGFFSTSEQSGQSIDLLTLFIPSNPFHSFANTIVPAAVVFSILLGVALNSVPGEQGLLDVLGNLGSALMRMASFVTKLAPHWHFYDRRGGSRNASAGRNRTASGLYLGLSGSVGLTDLCHASLTSRNRPRLSIIRQRGVIRVGYLAERLPFVYKNESSELVGYDMDLAHDLAQDLGVTMEISPCTWEAAGAWLHEGRIDVLVGGLAVTPGRAEAFAFTHAYMDLTTAFIVRDHRRDEFSSRAKMRRIGSLRIAIPEVRYYLERLLEPLSDLETVRVDSFKPFFRGEMNDVDALVFSAEHGTACTMTHPDYSLVVPADLKVKVPIGLGLPRHQPAMTSKLLVRRVRVIRLRGLSSLFENQRKNRTSRITADDFPPPPAFFVSSAKAIPEMAGSSSRSLSK